MSCKPPRACHRLVEGLSVPSCQTLPVEGYSLVLIGSPLVFQPSGSALTAPLSAPSKSKPPLLMTEWLLDVNVLLALAWPNHLHHGLAQSWFRKSLTDGWATCSLTELGFID